MAPGILTATLCSAPQTCCQPQVELLCFASNKQALPRQQTVDAEREKHDHVLQCLKKGQENTCHGVSQ